MHYPDGPRGSREPDRIEPEGVVSPVRPGAGVTWGSRAAALGLTDRFVVGVAAEAIGKGTPLAVMPCVNTACVRHSQFEQSIAVLRGAGVRVLYGEDGFTPHPPGRGGAEPYPWSLALDAVDDLVRDTAQGRRD
ncbi:hypothetical protein Slala04_47410 [Streptomyces lavendulae subsp. lavendulae]|nr:hypothetical protein ADK49_21055 [Streptomyces sp. WM6349]KOU80621.1 hypothetical protein ADK94_29305 [Streptomyces sp. XY593]KOV42255.1 hypothetical protein ADK98_24620 [Streptomyces sp. H036]GLV93287.1 hypothetical protein Slala04_47410 [Streptomyces lavendulae subsp. lavendulae]